MILAIKIPLSFGADDQFRNHSFIMLSRIPSSGFLLSPSLVSVLRGQFPRLAGQYPRTSLPEIVLDDIDVINHDLCLSAQLLEFILL